HVDLAGKNLCHGLCQQGENAQQGNTEAEGRQAVLADMCAESLEPAWHGCLVCWCLLRDFHKSDLSDCGVDGTLSQDFNHHNVILDDCIRQHQIVFFNIGDSAVLIDIIN